jgi:hypothetical protein
VVDRAVSRFGSFLEKLLLWALEGEKSPFSRKNSKPAETTHKPFTKKRNKYKGLDVLAHKQIHQKA